MCFNELPFQQWGHNNWTRKHTPNVIENKIKSNILFFYNPFTNKQNTI